MKDKSIYKMLMEIEEARSPSQLPFSSIEKNNWLKKMFLLWERL